MPIPQNIDMVKTGTGYNIHIQAHDLRAIGLGDLSINYLKAIQRHGHRDLRVNLTLSTNLRLEGLYSLKVFLTFLKQSGADYFLNLKKQQLKLLIM